MPGNRYPVQWLGGVAGALTLYSAMRALDTVVQQVQQSGSDMFGGMETLGSGLRPSAVVERTRSLLTVWYESSRSLESVQETVVWTAILYTVADVLFLVCCTALLVSLYRWLTARCAGRTAFAAGTRWVLLRQLAEWPRVILLPIGAAVADLAEDGLRLGIVAYAFGAGEGTAPAWVILLSWSATTAKFVLFALSLVVLLLLGQAGRVMADDGKWIRWSAWRLRVPIGATVVFVGLVLGDPTGQVADLMRRWIDSVPDLLTGLASIIGAVLLGVTTWLITRRIVLADQGPETDPEGRRNRSMTYLWAVVLAAAAVMAVVVLGWKFDRSTSVIVGVAVALLAYAARVAGLPPDRPRTRLLIRILTDWRMVLLAATVAAWIVAAAVDWHELRAPATVASVVLGLEFIVLVVRLWRRRRAVPATALDRKAGDARSSRAGDAGPADPDQARTTRLLARLVAVASPVAVLIAAAGAYAPVPLVLGLSGGEATGQFVGATVAALILLVAPAVVAVVGYTVLRRQDRTPVDQLEPLEKRYRVIVVLVVAGAAAGLIGGVAGWTGIGPLCIVAAFLSTTVVALGELELWSDTHEPPDSFLLVGLTRVPPVTLLVAVSLLAGLVFGQGTGHQVHRTGSVPGTLADGNFRPGVDLGVAFHAWTARNCADRNDPDAVVPLVLVAAPGGGLRAAYWTASTLTGLFGAATTTSGTSCPGSPADRVFATGGASGGSLGELAWISGLDNKDRKADWYDEELVKPDFLTDPLAWLLTVDLSRSYLGFGGEDRAHRLEKRWTASMAGLGGDFFAGSWGAGGTSPVALLTGTQVETGCRVNISGLRVTDRSRHEQESSCLDVHDGPGQRDAPAVSDLLDHLCGTSRGSSPESVNRATAALLSARFPWVSPSGQLNRCAEADPRATEATRISVVDGGYADNTGAGLLLDLWPRLEQVIAEHNAKPGVTLVVPLFLEVDNHYEAVATPAAPGRTAETLVPPLTRGRPDKLDDLIMRARVEAVFAGPGPQATAECKVGPAGRYVRISPRISPGLPAPLAWTLSEVATQDLRSQREKALMTPAAEAIKAWSAGTKPAGCRRTPGQGR